MVRERREKVVAEARRAVEAGQVAEVEVRAASREVGGGESVWVQEEQLF